MGFLSEQKAQKKDPFSLFTILGSLFTIYIKYHITILDIDVTVLSFCWSAARPSPDPPFGSPFESHSVAALPLDEASRSGRSPRDFRPLQSNP